MRQENRNSHSFHAFVKKVLSPIVAWDEQQQLQMFQPAPRTYFSLFHDALAMLLTKSNI
jgi:hypothetical protein